MTSHSQMHVYDFSLVTGPLAAGTPATVSRSNTTILAPRFPVDEPSPPRTSCRSDVRGARFPGRGLSSADDTGVAKDLRVSVRTLLRLCTLLDFCTSHVACAKFAGVSGPTMPACVTVACVG